MIHPLCGRGSMPARPSAFTVGPKYRVDYDDDLGLRLPVVPRWADCEQAGIEEPGVVPGTEIERLLRPWAEEDGL